ncbi:MAG: TaqI-like C-terminal specificity domain-containing protein [Cytophagales bacterium]
MDKKQLQNILSSAYSLENWREVLTNIFNVRSLNLEPKPILLPANNKADSAFELGNFNTSDDRIIGIYQVNVTVDVWLERNKVGLRELLRNVYKYDVDGALVVFVQEDKWRLSFISEIRTINEQGEIEKKTTEPKRYTYLLGKGEKTKTATNNLFAISGKKHTLEDIRNAFSVEALNEEFYKIIAEQFYKLVGATAGKGAKAVKYERVLQLPSVPETDHKTFQEFAVRLIGRAVFCWFLKVKKSDEGIPLLPENLLSSISVKENEGYYHTILERLFFQTLNTKVEKRVKDLPKGTELIPFLNGGLFEPQDDDFYKPNKSTGLSENLNTLVIPDQWFIEFFDKLEQYNFTIDENSVVDIEVSVDPEMLGRIFENLLAEIDPDSGETARKATGSFYTPREIVDYMATESLVHYLHNKTGVEQEALHSLFKIDQSIHSSLITHNSSLLEALDSLKILDPACGSGAFPMGVLQKIVMALQKLDKDAVWWTARQVDKNTDPTARKAVKEKLANNAQYARKIGIIQNSLYGVDIQPIAAEISKLRCFLTLIVDEHIIETKPNRGIEPLPNLEFKFVTADTLRKLPTDLGGLFNNFDDDLDQLKRIRLDYLQSTGDEKLELKQEFKTIQDSVVKKQAKTNALDPNSRAFLISTWNPFSHERSNWFDPQWMYGIKDFDIVIGNPPYVLLQNTSMDKIEQEALRKSYLTAQYKTDLYHLFIEKGIELCKEVKGILCYITPNTFLKNKHNDLLRKYIIKETHLLKVIRFNVPIFRNASVDNSIFITERQKGKLNNKISIVDISKLPFNIENQTPKSIAQESILPNEYSFDFDLGDNLFERLKYFPKVKDLGRAYFGIQTFDRSKYVSGVKINKDYFPVVDGTNVTRYNLKKNIEYVEFTPEAIKSGGNKDVYKKDRILIRQIGKFPEGCYCPPDIYTLNTIYNIFINDKSYDIKYVLALINSKLIQAYWLRTNFDNKETFPKIKKEPLESLPIAKANQSQQFVFKNIVESIMFIKSVADININEHVPNSHIVQLFEEVIDAMVFELYFEEDFKKADIAFIKYAERDFESIEGKSEEEAIKIIHSAYQKLREKDNEIRNNLQLMDSRLHDLVMPIKTAK